MSSQDSLVLEAKPLLTGLVIGESPRWHEGRLWFANWGAEEIVALDLEGNAEVVAKGPPGLGWSIDWLPDGRLLVTGEGLMRLEPDGSVVPHADLSGLGVDGFNEIVVDGRGNIYVNGGVPSPRSRRPKGESSSVKPTMSSVQRHCQAALLLSIVSTHLHQSARNPATQIATGTQAGIPASIHS
jgi:sugar lactone lactonase YvrE